MKLKLYLFKKELFFFLLAQLLGIYTAFRLFPVLATQVRQDVSGAGTFALAAAFLVLVVLFLIVKRKAIFYRLFLIVIIFLGAQTVLSIFFDSLLSNLGALAVLAAMFMMRSILAQNLAVTFAIAGIGGVLGLSFSPTVAVVILVVFSFYDIIAVYKTKHMIKMAEEMIKSRAIFGIIVTSAKPKEFMILGSGDILLPLLLAASVVSASVVSALVIAAFSSP